MVAAVMDHRSCMNELPLGWNPGNVTFPARLSGSLRILMAYLCVRSFAACRPKNWGSNRRNLIMISLRGGEAQLYERQRPVSYRGDTGPYPTDRPSGLDDELCAIYHAFCRRRFRRP